MIVLNAYPAKTFYEGPKSELRILFSCLRVKNKNSYWHSKALLRKLAYVKDAGKRSELVKAAENIKWIKFYDTRRSWFGTGLLSRVKAHLEKEKLKLKIIDHRLGLPDLLPAEFIFVGEFEERPEQVNALERACKFGSGLLHLPTNFGKTDLACGMVALYKERVGVWPKTLFLTHRIGLAYQAQKRFERHLGISIGLIGGGAYGPLDITASTVQTISRRLHLRQTKVLLQDTQIIFIDEIHVNRARQVYKIMMQCGARMRFGLSGTISDKEERRLRMEQLVGPVIAKDTNENLIQLGRSAKPIIRLVEVGSKGFIEGLGYRKSYVEGLIHSVERNFDIVREALAYANRDLRTLILVLRIEHGRILERIFQGLEVGCEFIHGGTPQFAREEVKKRFEKRKIPVLIASSILEIGEDLPVIDALVLGGAGKGWELVLQRIGRAIRRKPGENKVYISDFLDLHDEYLQEHSLRRWEHYRSEGFKIRVIKAKASKIS